jgi:orotidine-5'-phosphate decarboxylase
MSEFAQRLIAAVQRTASPVLVGLDPCWEQLPAAVRPDESEADTQRRADAYRRFCCEVIDAVAAHVPAVKPQAAFFEQLGPPGMVAMHAVIEHAHRRGLLVILDGKRNDIGSTGAAYADGYLGGQSAWQADALTVSPYLGDDSLAPFVETARQRAAGVFVLVKTSNPGGGQFQDLLCDGRPLYRYVAEWVERRAVADAGPGGYGSVGAVVGATYPQQLSELRSAMPHAWLLIPGYGSQGATAADVAGGFDAHGLGAIVNNSRGIIFAFRREPFAGRFGATRWQQAVEAASLEMLAELRAQTPAGRLLTSRPRA